MAGLLLIVFCLVGRAANNDHRTISLTFFLSEVIFNSKH